jgi:hypothetical protein
LSNEKINFRYSLFLPDIWGKSQWPPNTNLGTGDQGLGSGEREEDHSPSLAAL